MSRFRRIETEINNHNMEMFRWEVEKYLSYKIIPVYMSQEGLEPLFEYEIEKTEIYFRQVNEITKDDIDSCCINGDNDKNN